MSSSSKFNSSRPSWREREALKERQQREAAAKAAEEQQRKQYANTEANFPSTMAVRPALTKTAVPQGFSAMASKWQQQEELERQLEAYRKSNSDRERRAILDTVYILRRRSAGFHEEDDTLYDDDISTIPEETEDINEKFPPHGRRGTYTEPDGEGWRTVIKRQRKQKRTLTEAELAQKYRQEFFEREDNDSDDLNGDLTDRNQRREFY